VSAASTPLWADHQRTLKKGLVASGAEFKADSVTFDGGQDMLKTSTVTYTRKGDGLVMVGDGWIELKNCDAVVPPNELEEDQAWLFLKQLRDALDVALGSH
jgi:hypothetical protein